MEMVQPNYNATYPRNLGTALRVGYDKGAEGSLQRILFLENSVLNIKIL